MKANHQTISHAQAARELAWEMAYRDWENDRQFRRARRRGIVDALRRLLNRGRRVRYGGRSLAGWRPSDRINRIELPLASVAGFVDSGGSVLIGSRPLSLRLRPLWRRLLREPGAASPRPPRAYRLGGSWFLDSSQESILALELARARGEPSLAVATPVRAFGMVSTRDGEYRDVPGVDGRKAG